MIIKEIFVFHLILLLYFHITGPGDHRWVGMWWGGFLLCGFLLILVAIPFFSFPKVLVREKEKIRLVEKAAAANGASASKPPPKPQTGIKDTGYGKDIKGKTFVCAGHLLSTFSRSALRLMKTSVRANRNVEHSHRNDRFDFKDSHKKPSEIK